MIPLITCTVAITAALGVIYLFNEHAKEISLKSSLKKMADETQLLAHHYRTRHDQVSDDVRLLAQESNARSLIERQAGTESNAVPEAGDDVLKQHVADLFEALLEIRPDYTQVRLIGVRNGGAEIVRVNRNAEGEISRTQETSLQVKSGEPYFKQAIAHDWAGHSVAAAPVPRALFSRIGFKRENGQISYPLSYTLRAMYPLLDDSNRPAGFIVINVDYAKFLSSALGGVALESNVFVLNGRGDYLSYFGGGRIAGLEIRGQYTRPPSAMVQALLETDQASGVLQDSEAVSYFETVVPGDDHSDLWIKIAFVQPMETLLQEVGGVGWQSVLAAALIVALALVVVMILISLILRPFKILETEVKRAEEGETALNLPVQWKNELGQLAKAFQSLVDKHVQAETRLGLIIDNIGEGVVTIDEIGTIMTFNPACERIFQYAADEVIGKNIGMLMPSRQARRHHQFLTRYLEEGKRGTDWSARLETGKRSDGTEFPLELTVTELQFEKKPLYVGILRDVSERQIAEKAKLDFLASISHELRTPLTSIRGALGLLQSDAVAASPEKKHKITAVAVKNCERLQDLIDGLLDMDRLEGKRFRLNKELLDLRDLPKNVSPLMQNLQDQYGVHFEIAGDSQYAQVLGDRMQLRRVLANLLSNAAKFSKPGDKVVIRVLRDTERKVARLTVSDRGSGVPEAARAKIFEKFSRAESSDAGSQGGAGIGLAIAAELIALHGGSLQYMPVDGGGSAFFFDLPLANNATTGAVSRKL